MLPPRQPPQVDRSNHNRKPGDQHQEHRDRCRSHAWNEEVIKLRMPLLPAACSQSHPKRLRSGIRILEEPAPVALRPWKRIELKRRDRSQTQRCTAIVPLAFRPGLHRRGWSGGRGRGAGHGRRGDWLPFARFLERPFRKQAPVGPTEQLVQLRYSARDLRHQQASPGRSPVQNRRPRRFWQAGQSVHRQGQIVDRRVVDPFLRHRVGRQNHVVFRPNRPIGAVPTGTTAPLDLRRRLEQCRIDIHRRNNHQRRSLL